MKPRLILVAALVAALAVIPSAQAAPGPYQFPLAGQVVRDFDPPAQPWLAGHRGVDIAGSVGQSVASAQAGVVSFVGTVAGVAVVTVSHGTTSTTYQPVAASVVVGQTVAAGQEIGTLLAGHACPAAACLHWGLRQGDDYLDPLSLLATSPVRLIGADQWEQLRQRAAQAPGWRLDGRVSAAGLVAPAAGPVSSAYGMRWHPIDQVWRFHDGLDIAAGCGTPIVAAAAGQVVEVWYSPGYGNRLVIDHGQLGAHQLRTAYNHAQAYQVAPGDQVSAGQIVGWIGTTGASTGCHLHFSAWLDTVLTDPQPLLP
jgi:murein DD-endopeptidase MepM/ murein hydrolase activator NlpD